MNKQNGTFLAVDEDNRDKRLAKALHPLRIRKTRFCRHGEHFKQIMSLTKDARFLFNGSALESGLPSELLDGANEARRPSATQ